MYQVHELAGISTIYSENEYIASFSAYENVEAVVKLLNNQRDKIESLNCECMRLAGDKLVLKEEVERLNRLMAKHYD